MARVDKWDYVCRLCSEEREQMLSIFGNEGLQRKIAQKLRACLPILVYKTDPLPKQICRFCATRLDDAYEFREHCLNVYKNMNSKLLVCKQNESVYIFLDAMKNSPDPCQAQLYKTKSRAPPPLVPLPSLPSLLSLDDSSISFDQSNHEQFQNTYMEALPELPCEVEIKEMDVDSVLNNVICGSPNTIDDDSSNELCIDVSEIDMGNLIPRTEYQINKVEKKRTSILEQALTGNLIINNRQELESKNKLTSEWWCAPCNSYYRTKESLMKHLQLHCPRVYTCRKCSASFDSVEHLAKHEAVNHLKVTLNFTENLKDCHQCERQFVSWEMLRQHRLRDHLAELTTIGINTWCSLCNRFFPTIESYQNHVQLHETNNLMPLVVKATVPKKIIQRPRNGKKEEQFFESVKSLHCPTCGKICSQQSALSNHMRTHEPKKHKCDICGRSFGLLIRLIAHKMAEHNDPVMSPVLSAIEQEDALNAEREAREAREARTRGGKKRHYSEITEREDIPTVEDPTPRRYSGFNVSRCGICQQWFNNHTKMLAHLRTHSDNSSKNSDASLLIQQCTTEVFSKISAEPLQRTSSQSLNKRYYKCSKCSKSFASTHSRNSHMMKAHAEGVYDTMQRHNIDAEACDETMPILQPEPIFLEYNVPLIEPQVEINEHSAPPPLKRTLIRTTNGYRCGVCQSPFVLRDLAIAHLRSAHPVMPYQCPYCKQRFTTQYTFTHHIKEDHPDEPEK